MEKLFVQIFERKNRIIEHVKQQTELYNQNLASKLLIEGITPPSWLWSPTGSSNSKELNKEDLISKLLGPYTLASVRCSSEQYPLYDKQFISGAKREFSDGFLMDALDNFPNGLGRSATRGDTDAGCSQNCAPDPELNFSITSPKDQTTGGFLNISNAPDHPVARIQRSKSRQKAPDLDFSITSPKDQTIGGFLNISTSPDQSVARIQRSKSRQNAPGLDFGITSHKDQTTGGFLNISNAPDQSVARIQRSKSRQKALEFRNSANTVADSALDHENISGTLSSRIGLSISSSKKTGNENELPELEEPCAVDGSCCEDLDEAACQNKDNGMDLYSGRITRSRSHVKVLGSGRTSLELGHSQNDRKDVLFHGSNTSKRSSVCTSSRGVADYCNKLLQSPGSLAAFAQNDGDITFRAGSLSKEKAEVYSAKISPFKSFHRPQSCATDSSKADSLSNDAQRMVGTIMNFGDDLNKDHIDESPVTKNIFYVCHVDKDGQGSILEDGKSYKESSNISEPGYCSEIPSRGGSTLSRSSPRKNSAANDKAQNFSGCQTRPPWCETKEMLDEQRNVDFMVNNEFVAHNLINHSLSSSANGDEQIRVSFSENTTPKRPRFNTEGGNCQYPEVEDEADLMMSKMEDTSTLKFHPTEQCWEQGHKTSAEQVIEEGNWIGEGSLKSSEVSHSTGSKDVRKSCFPKPANNPGEEPHGFSSRQTEMSNPMCVTFDKIEQFPAHESQILSCLTGRIEDNRLVANYKSTKQSEDLLLEGRFELVSIGSWPQLKRRKIEELQVHRLTSYPSSVKHGGSILRDSASRYLRNLETDVNTDFTNSLDRKMNIDIEMDQDKDTYCINTENLTHTMRMLQAGKSPPSVYGHNLQCLVLSPKSKDPKLDAESMPVFQRFNVEMQADIGDMDFTANGVDLAELRLSRNAIEHASIIEEMCRSASLDTPMSHLSSALNFQGTINPLQSLPNGLLEHLNLKANFSLNVNASKKLDSGKSLVNDMGGTLERIERVPYSASLPYSGTRYGWNSRIEHASPVGSLWERLSSHTGSSEKCSISNPELTCFPIEEDPISEDNNLVDHIVDDVVDETDTLLTHDCNMRYPPKDLTNIGLNSSVSTFAQRDIMRADILDVMVARSNVGGTQDDLRWSPKNQFQYDCEMRENQGSSLGNTKRKSYQTLPIGYDGTKKAKVSIDEIVRKPSLSSKTSLKKQEQNVSLKDSKRNNIVSNICSFIPLVQQTQAAAVCVGKRDIKVKALEAAEAAKRLEEKKVNERKNRKEALKLERAKLEAENVRKMELEKKRKELERKKKDADAIAKKRSREEEERKEKQRKRMRLQARIRQREEEEERGHAEIAENEKRHTKDEQINSKKSYNAFKKEQNRGGVRGDDVASKKAVIEECCTSGDSFEAEKALHAVNRSPKNEDLIVQKRQEKSYEISPYQCSDDEDEEDEELPTKKYIPSWASKSSMGLHLPLQRKIEPDLIFYPESFCCMDEVLLPRKLLQRQMDA